MTRLIQKLLFPTALACVVLAMAAMPAMATTTHHKHHKVRHHYLHTKGSVVVRIAQQHLANLGYYGGKIDGIMGPQTRAAIKRFQQEQGLKTDGILGPKTNKALDEADRRVIGTHSQPITHDDLDSTNPDYTTSLSGGSKVISSRFARVDVSESNGTVGKYYTVNLNGQPILTADGQPSVIGMSPTYDLGNEDAIIFTTYSLNDTLCPYKNHVLAMNDTANTMLDIGNCTRGYQAHVDGGSLYISFPEVDDQRALPAVWRLEGINLQRL